MSIFDLQHRRTAVDMTNVFLFMSAVSISFTWVSGIDVSRTLPQRERRAFYGSTRTHKNINRYVMRI